MGQSPDEMMAAGLRPADISSTEKGGISNGAHLPEQKWQILEISSGDCPMDEPFYRQTQFLDLTLTPRLPCKRPPQRQKAYVS